jgi:hypothetical protein
MKSNHPQPVILSLPTIVSIREESPTVPFPGRGRSTRHRVVHRRVDRRPRDEDRDSPLGEMRNRLLKFIVANEWERTHGNRAS